MSLNHSTPHTPLIFIRFVGEKCMWHGKKLEKITQKQSYCGNTRCSWNTLHYTEAIEAIFRN